MKRTRIGLIKALLARGATPSTVVTHLQVRAALKDCKTVLDVGCGNTSPLQMFGIEQLIGIDGYQPAVEGAKSSGAYQNVILGDIRQLSRQFSPRQFEACVALDVIEHLPKEEGKNLIRDLELIASKKVILLTPNGFLPQRHTEQSDLQEHLSGWEPEEMRGLGYEVQGVLGPKSFRGEYHRLIKKPAVLWGVVSLLADVLYTRRRPSSSAAILCLKRTAHSN